MCWIFIHVILIPLPAGQSLGFLLLSGPHNYQLPAGSCPSGGSYNVILYTHTLNNIISSLYVLRVYYIFMCCAIKTAVQDDMVIIKVECCWKTWSTSLRQPCPFWSLGVGSNHLIRKSSNLKSSTFLILSPLMISRVGKGRGSRVS